MGKITIEDYDADSYRTFLAAKRIPIHRVVGNVIHIEDVSYTTNDTRIELAVHLWDYERFIVRLALARKRLAVFAWIGLGKTAMFLEWVRHVQARVTPKKVLIITPIHLIRQTQEEQIKFYGESGILDINATLGGDIEAFAALDGPMVGIVNTDKFNRSYRLQEQIGAVVLDESGCLKDETSVRRTNIINSCKGIQYKLACSATPAPNDRQEYANHALFLDYIDNYKQFFSKFFYNDGTASNFILKPHAKRAFYEFLSTWSIFLRDPGTYGFKDNVGGLEEPELIWERINLTDDQRKAAMDYGTKGQLNMFSGNAGGIVSRGKVSQISKGFVYANK